MQETKKLPVLSITLKDMDARDFEGAKAALSTLIGRAALCFSFLSKSEKLTGEQRAQYTQLIRNDAEGRQIFSISEEEVKAMLDYYGLEKYESVIKEWFREEAGKDISRLDALCEAFARGDGREIF